MLLSSEDGAQGDGIIQTSPDEPALLESEEYLWLAERDFRTLGEFRWTYRDEVLAIELAGAQLRFVPAEDGRLQMKGSGPDIHGFWPDLKT